MDILALTPTYNQLTALRYFTASVLETLDAVPELRWVFIDNGSKDETLTFLKSLSHPRLTINFLETNIGKGNAFNQYARNVIKNGLLPDIIFSIDSDIIFTPSDFKTLCDAIRYIPNVGYISPRYTKNSCNPERNLWFPAHTYKGADKKKYKLKKPFLCNIAGGMIGMPGHILSSCLEYEFYPKSEGKVYYPDDGFLYDKMKKFKKNSGYLEGVYVTHLRSKNITAYPDTPPPL